MKQFEQGLAHSKHPEVEVTPVASGGRAWDKAEKGEGPSAVPGTILRNLPSCDRTTPEPRLELTQFPSLTELPTGGCEEILAPGPLPACCWARHLCASGQKETRALHWGRKALRMRWCGEASDFLSWSLFFPVPVFSTPPSALPHHLAPCYSGWFLHW